MPVWTAEAKYRLLLSIITSLDTKPPKWEDVAKLMGPEYSQEAIRQQYNKIKRSVDTELNTAKANTRVEVLSPLNKRARSSKQKGSEPHQDSQSPKTPSKKSKNATTAEEDE